MRSRFRICCCLSALAVTLIVLGGACSGPAAGPDKGESWPTFGGGPQRSMVNLFAKNAPTDWSVQEGMEKKVKWSAQLGSNAHGGPTVAGGKVFVGTNNDKPRDPKIEDDKGVVMCFDAATGKFLWQAVHDKLPNPGENDFPNEGICSTPAVEGNRVYYVSNRCEVVCADVETGKPAWKLDMIKEFGVYPCQMAACSPLVVGDLVYVVTGNGVSPESGKVINPKAPSFLALDRTNGKVVWQDASPGDKILEGQWSNPAYAEVNGQGQVIFPGGDGWLYGFEAKTGKPLWKFDCNPKTASDKPVGRGERKNFPVATPAVWDNKVYLGTGRTPGNDSVSVGHFWCIDLTKTGDVSPVGDNFDPKAEVNKNSALVWHFGGMNTDPKVRRKFLASWTLSTCCLHDGLCYVADFNGYLYCFDAKTGEKLWDYDLKGSVWASPLYLDGKIWIGIENGDLYVLPHGRQKPATVMKIDVGQSIKSVPVMVNGVLYMQTDSRLYAIADK